MRFAILIILSLGLNPISAVLADDRPTSVEPAKAKKMADAKTPSDQATSSVPTIAQPSEAARGDRPEDERKPSELLGRQSSKTEPPEPGASAPNRAEAEKSGRFAVDSWLLVLFTGILAVFTALLWDATKKLWRAGEAQIALARTAADAANTSAQAAIESNKLNREAFTADQRPWVALDVGISSPLTFGSDGWHIEIRYRVRNVGRTPAIGPDISAEILPFMIPHWPTKDGVPTGTPESGSDAAALLKKLAGNSGEAIRQGAFSGQILFPNEEREGRFEIYAKDHPAFVTAMKSQGYSGQFLLLVCASYGSTFHAATHVTGKSFSLFKANLPTRTGSESIAITGETVPVANLAIASTPMGGSLSN